MSTQRLDNDPVDNQRAPARDGQQPSPAAPSRSNSTSTSPANNRATLLSMLEDRAYYQSFLDKLLHSISNADEEEVSRIISFIRSGASQHDILDMIDRLPGSGGRESNGVSHRSQ